MHSKWDALIWLLIVLAVTAWAFTFMVTLSRTPFKTAVRFVHALSIFPLIVFIIGTTMVLLGGFTGAARQADESRSHGLTILTMLFFAPAAIGLYWLWHKLLAWADESLTKQERGMRQKEG
jgi:hypothetical protein